MNKNLDNYYEIASLVGDNIEVVAYLVATFKLQKNNKIIRDLEVHNFHNYEEIFEKILDMKLKTIQDLCVVFLEIIEAQELQEELIIKKVDNTINIFDFIEEDNGINNQ